MSAGPFAGHPVSYAQARDRGAQRATVAGVHDGDTVRLVVDAAFDVAVTVAVRIAGVNAPELHAGPAVARAAGRASRDALADLLPVGAPVLVRTHKAATGTERRSFVRYVADVAAVSGDGTEQDVAGWLVAAGHAVAVGRR